MPESSISGWPKSSCHDYNPKHGDISKVKVTTDSNLVFCLDHLSTFVCYHKHQMIVTHSMKLCYAPYLAISAHGQYYFLETIGNHVLRRHTGFDIKLNFRLYIRRYTSPNENFELNYPLNVKHKTVAEL